MNAALNQLGDRLYESFGQVSIELAALAILVLIADRFLRKAPPAVRHLLWVALLLKPVVALVVSSPWTVFSPLNTVFAPSLGAVGGVPLALGAAAASKMAATTTVASGSGPALTLVGWLAALWTVGAVLVVCWIVVGYGVVRRLRHRAEVHRAGPLVDALREARMALGGTDRAEVATSDSIRSPLVLGVFRPLILIPVDVVERLQPDQLVMVLMHELAHVRRHDNLTLFTQRMLAVALFFHPVVWLCERMLRREAEQACDDFVVCATEQSEEYARGLTGVAELVHLPNHSRRRIPMVNVFAAAESDLALRIRRALGGNARRMSGLSRVVTAAALSAVFVLTLPSCNKSGGSDGVGSAAGRIAGDASGAELTSYRRMVASAAMATDPDEWSDELKAQLLDVMAPGSTIESLAEAFRGGRAWREALNMPREEWSDELIARLVEAESVSSFEEIPELNYRRRVWSEAFTSSPDAWSDELKSRILAINPGRDFGVRPGSTIEELAEFIRKSQGGGPVTHMDSLALRTLAAFRSGEMTREEAERIMITAAREEIREHALETPVDEWSDRFKEKITRAGWDLEVFTESVRTTGQAPEAPAE